MIKEGKHFTDMMKKNFNKKLVMTKKDDEDFENSIKCWICDNFYLDGEVKVRAHYYITGKYRGSARRGCNINVNLTVVYHNLKKYDSTHI